MEIRDFALERFFARWEFEVPHLLCASDIEPLSIAETLALADDETRALWDELRLGYTESRGHPLLRAEIASLYEGIEADDVLVFAGAEEAIFVFMNVVLGSGGELLVTRPGYQSLYEIAGALGARVTPLELRWSRSWAFDVAQVTGGLTSATRAVAVNFPHNPTGVSVSADDFAAVVDACRQAGVHLLSDEVYRLLEHDEATRLPAAADVYERGVSLGVTSKAFALAGLRIGWLATRDRALLDRLAAFKDYTTICNSAPSEILALIALRARDEILERNLSLVLANLAVVDEFFERNDWIEWIRPKAGCIGFPRLRLREPVASFARALAEEEGVLVLPGEVYEHPGDHFRLGFGRAGLPEALHRFERFCLSRLGPRPA